MAAYTLWHQFLPHIPKSSRYTLGEKIDSCLLDIIELIFSASYAAINDRIVLVRRAGTKLDATKFFLQIVWETRALDNKKYIAISERLDEIGRMLGGWMRQLSSKETPPK